MSGLEEALLMQMQAAKLPAPEREYRFAAHHVGLGKGIKSRLSQEALRDWRFDFAWPDFGLAVEVEGGIYVSGRHTRGYGYEMDLLKYSKAMLLGWTVYRCGKSLINSGEALETIEFIMGRARE